MLRITTLDKSTFFAQFGEFLQLYRQVDRDASDICNYANAGNNVCCVSFPNKCLNDIVSQLRKNGVSNIVLRDKDGVDVICMVRDIDITLTSAICEAAFQKDSLKGDV